MDQPEEDVTDILFIYFSISDLAKVPVRSLESQ